MFHGFCYSLTKLGCRGGLLAGVQCNLFDSILSAHTHTPIPVYFNETAGSGKFENNVRQVVGGEFMLYVGR